MPTRFWMVCICLATSWLTPAFTSALERDTPDRFFLEYERVSARVTQLSQDLDRPDRRSDLQRVIGVLDQLATAREHLARYDAAHQLSATRLVSIDHSRLRALFYAYEAMAQMVSAQVDYQVTKSESLRRLAERYRETWQEAETGIRLRSLP